MQLYSHHSMRHIAVLLTQDEVFTLRMMSLVSELNTEAFVSNLRTILFFLFCFIYSLYNIQQTVIIT